MKNRIFEKIKKYALKNRQIPEYNRRQVGKSMSILAIFLFFVFLINFAIIIGTDQKSLSASYCLPYPPAAGQDR